MTKNIITLPLPKKDGSLSIEKALSTRRSVRKYSSQLLSLDDIGQIMWSVQGMTHRIFRTAPSAGALYPLELYITGMIDENLKGLFHYDVKQHSLTQRSNQDCRNLLSEAAYNQPWVKNAPVVVVITAMYDRVMKKYGKKGVQYTHFEVGHAAQNIHLQLESLKLGTVCVAGFDEKKVKEILQLTEESPQYLMPIGYPADR
jgi:SagB-type dehydrogenase family enzyme